MRPTLQRAYDTYKDLWGDSDDASLIQARIRLLQDTYRKKAFITLREGVNLVPDYFTYIDMYGVPRYQSCLAVSFGRPCLLEEGAIPMIVDSETTDCLRLLGLKEAKTMEMVFR